MAGKENKGKEKNNVVVTRDELRKKMGKKGNPADLKEYINTQTRQYLNILPSSILSEMLGFQKMTKSVGYDLVKAHSGLLTEFAKNEPIINMISNLTSITGPLNQQLAIDSRNNIKGLIPSIKNILKDQKLYSQIADLKSFKYPLAIDFLNEFKNKFKFNINPDNTLQIDNELYNPEDIQKIADEIMEETQLQNRKIDINDIFSKLIELSKEYPQKIKKIISGFILFVVFQFLYENVIKPEFANILKKIPKKQMRIIKKNVEKQNLPIKILKQIRYVRVQTLNVRLKNCRRSKKIGELHLGEVVCLLDKKKDWSLVYRKENEAEIRGWVFSRYLGIIK